MQNCFQIAWVSKFYNKHNMFLFLYIDKHILHSANSQISANLHMGVNVP